MHNVVIKSVPNYLVGVLGLHNVADAEKHYNLRNSYNLDQV